MKEEQYIAAIEIGSHKITGEVGIYNPASGSLNVVAVEQEMSRESVRYGIIQNPEEVSARVRRIVTHLENSTAVYPRKITGVYVGLSGRSMRSVPAEVKMEFPGETDITEEMLGRLREDAADISLDSNLEILDTVPRSYLVDGLETTSPKGSVGKSITAKYDIIVGRSELKRNVIRAIADRAGLEIKGFCITQLAAADVVLSDEEKRLGCMLVDLGAETTSVSIYRKGALCYYATIPLGSRNITRDITHLSVLEETAEEIKRESGRAIPPETPSTLNIKGIKLSDVGNLVVARAEEIVANVLQQISYAGLKERDLPAGIICIGNGSNLSGIIDLLGTQSRMNSRRGQLIPEIITSDNKSKRHDTIQASAILYDAAMTGDADCVLHEQQSYENSWAQPEPEPSTPNNPRPSQKGGLGKLLRGISSKFSNMFASNEEDESELD